MRWLRVAPAKNVQQPMYWTTVKTDCGHLSFCFTCLHCAEPKSEIHMRSSRSEVSKRLGSWNSFCEISSFFEDEKGTDFSFREDAGGLLGFARLCISGSQTALRFRTSLDVRRVLVDLLS